MFMFLNDRAQYISLRMRHYTLKLLAILVVSSWSSINEVYVTNPCNRPNSSVFHFYSNSFIKTSGQLIWSMFGLTDLQDLKADTGETTGVVLALFCIFLILSVIMLVNMLVALLTTTYDQASVRNLMF